MDDLDTCFFELRRPGLWIACRSEYYGNLLFEYYCYVLIDIGIKQGEIYTKRLAGGSFALPDSAS